MPTIKDSALQLSAETKADAEAIEVIAKKAVADIEAILNKYKDVPADVSLPALSQGRAVVTTINMHFPVKLAPPMALSVPA